MRNYILIIFLCVTLMTGHALGATAKVCKNIALNVSVQWENPTNYPQPLPKSPIQVPSVSLENHTLYFDTPCDGCTLNIVDENDVVVYTLVIPTGTTSLVLPSTLSGDYTIQIIRGYYLFYGTINLL